MAEAFETEIATCRRAYGVYSELAGRTDTALYQALGRIHALRCRIDNDAELAAGFRAVLRRSVGDKPVNETLFLVKYTFFPDTLQPGPGHKAEITKASRYTKLINMALDRGIEPADFVAFARDQGIQRTAAGSRSSERPHRRRVSVHHRRSARRSRAVAVSREFVGKVLAPLRPRFSSAELAVRLSECLRLAQEQPQQLSLAIYVHNDQAVITSVTGQAWEGQVPTSRAQTAHRAETVLLTPASAKMARQRANPSAAPGPRSTPGSTISTPLPAASRGMRIGDGLVRPTA